MNRAILALAASIFATLTIFGSAAQACISCEHVPVVVRGHTTTGPSPYYAKKRYLKKRSYAAAKRKRLEAAKRKKLAAAKRKKLEAAKRKKLAALKRTKETKTAAKAVESAESISIKATTEQSSISTASLDENNDVIDEPKREAKLTCKKFFPTVSMTLTVPCE